MDIQGLFKQFMKFAFVGGIAFLIDYSVLMLLTQYFKLDAVISASLSFSLSVVFNYLASMALVFERRDDLSRKREFTIFVLLSIIGLVINAIIMAAGTHVFGSGPFAITGIKIAATIIVTFWNFFSRKAFLEAK